MQDIQKALELWKSAAEENNNVDAHLNLYTAYMNGYGVAPNYNEAKKWYEGATSIRNLNAEEKKAIKEDKDKFQQRETNITACSPKITSAQHLPAEVLKDEIITLKDKDADFFKVVNYVKVGKRASFMREHTKHNIQSVNISDGEITVKLSPQSQSVVNLRRIKGSRIKGQKELEGKEWKLYKIEGNEPVDITNNQTKLQELFQRKMMENANIKMPTFCNR